MARIIYSGLVTSIRGSIGGTTFQSNAYGNTVKNKANMIVPNTIEQELRKLIFSKATKGWSSMTDSQRSEWNTYASTYPSYAKNNPSAQLSGFAIFVKWYAATFLGQGLDIDFLGIPVMTNPPLDTATIKVINAASVLTLDLTWVIGDEAWNVNFFLSRPFTATQNFVGTATRFIKWTTSVDNTINITSAYTSAFGLLPPVGQAVIVGAQLYNNNGGKVLATSFQRITVTAS